jgi:metal-responsive CopG/Arc/MetJ family transcriptional regulator
MKTIAITIDETTLAALDKLAAGGARRRAGGRAGNRSEVVRRAVQEYLDRRAQAERDRVEWEIWRKNLSKLNRDAAALVADQAEP